MKNLSALLLSILLTSQILLGQLPVKEWDYRYGGNNKDELRAVEHTADGGYILGGYSLSGITGDKTQDKWGQYDYWIVRVDSSGNKLWDKDFGGTKDDLFASLDVTSDGGFILGGGSWSPVSGDKTQGKQGEVDYWIVKTDISGNKQWDKRFGGTSLDYLTCIRQTDDGGYILGGDCFSEVSGDVSQVSRGGMTTGLSRQMPMAASNGICVSEVTVQIICAQLFKPPMAVTYSPGRQKVTHQEKRRKKTGAVPISGS